MGSGAIEESAVSIHANIDRRAASEVVIRIPYQLSVAIGSLHEMKPRTHGCRAYCMQTSQNRGASGTPSAKYDALTVSLATPQHTCHGPRPLPPTTTLSVGA